MNSDSFFSRLSLTFLESSYLYLEGNTSRLRKIFDILFFHSLSKRHLVERFWKYKTAFFLPLGWRLLQVPWLLSSCMWSTRRWQESVFSFWWLFIPLLIFFNFMFTTLNLGKGRSREYMESFCLSNGIEIKVPIALKFWIWFWGIRSPPLLLGGGGEVCVGNGRGDDHGGLSVQSTRGRSCGPQSRSLSEGQSQCAARVLIRLQPLGTHSVILQVSRWLWRTREMPLLPKSAS